MIGADRVFIVAEAGVNHNGSLELALKLIDAAAEAGADAVKFQTFRSEALVAADAAMADYQSRNIGTTDTQLEMLKRLELSHTDHAALVAHCRKRDIAFMSTAFDVDSLRVVIDCKPPVLKIPSGDVTAAPLVLATARAGLPIILSTGMCTLADVEKALGVIAFGLLGRDEQPSADGFAAAFASAEGQARLRVAVTILHCVTDYPAPPGQVNLRAMDTLASAFGLQVGYSDHCLGTAVSLAAVARGARVIEKHLTLDRGLPGPDHRASLEPSEFAQMVADIRDIELALGSSRKLPGEGEIRNRVVARRSLVALSPIGASDLFDEQNLGVQRPGDGVEPIHYWDLLGRAASRAYQRGERIDW